MTAASPGRAIDRVLIVGTGVMGRGIAQVCAVAGYPVDLLDVDQAAVGRALATLKEAIQQEASRGRLSQESANAAAARIAPAQSASPIGESTLVVEAIHEDLGAKQTLFLDLEKRAHPAAILATNTSSLSVTAIASACAHPGRVVGYHFFNPVPRMRLVEIVRGLKTTEATVEALQQLTDKIGFKAVTTADSPGFVVNHAGRAFVTEALQIASEQVADFATIDAILRETAGFRMGPFELLDLTGLDVSHPVMESIYRQYYEDPRYRPSSIARLRLQGRLLGRKSGAGFYAYPRNEAVSDDDIRVEESMLKPLRVFFGDGAYAVPEDLRALFLRSGEASQAHDTLSADICIVAPLGSDVATAVQCAGLPGDKTVAVDGLFFSNSAVTVMRSAATSQATVDLVSSLSRASKLKAHWILDSAGFVAQRVVAMIIHLACDIAQQGIASPTDVDLAVKLALGYPRGPFEWGQLLGGPRLLHLMQEIHSLTGDARYRPSQWLRRRVQLGISLDATPA